MKKLLLLSVSLLISAVSFSQKIKVTCKDVQTYYKSGNITNPKTIINNPDHDSGIKPADCDYTFDLQEMTSTFFSRSLGNIGSTIPINNVEQVGSEYVLTLTDYGRTDPNRTFFIKVYIDTSKKTMTHIWYDSSIDATIVNPTGTITMSVVDVQ